jgi:hypothetical protein
LLTLESSLPAAHYDPKILNHILDIEANAKSKILERLANGSLAVATTVKLFGLLMAGQDKQAGHLDHEAMVELGFTLQGLGDIGERLARTSDWIKGCVASDRAPEAEARRA